MKRLIGLMLIIGVALFMGGCNTPTDPNNTGGGGGDGGGGSGGGGTPGDSDVVFSWGEPGYADAPGNSTDFPGIMLALADCEDVTGTLGDITLYGEVIIDASLYASEDDFLADPKKPVTQQNGLAWFKILEDDNWAESLFPQGNNMKVNGESSAGVSGGKTGTPVYVLVQTPVASGVGWIEIRKLTFKLKTGAPVLELVYDNGSFIDVSGNTITFNNATYSDAAALYTFPDSWGATAEQSLKGKTITFKYSVPAHTCELSSGAPAGTTTGKHQIHIQAANGTADFNGQHPEQDKNGNAGQLYKDLDGATSITAAADELIAASQSTGSTDKDDYTGKFVLNAVRIVNNGTSYPDNSPTEFRCKSYKIVFDSITISP